jgi:hypothetical protein
MVLNRKHLELFFIPCGQILYTETALTAPALFLRVGRQFFGNRFIENPFGTWNAQISRKIDKNLLFSVLSVKSVYKNRGNY